MKLDDRAYFEQAIHLSYQAASNGFSPVGAVLVADNGMTSYAASRREIGNVFHAEFLAMYQWQRDGFSSPPPPPYTLYSTLEPCIMCSGMAAVMKVSRIKWLVDDVWAGTRLLNYNMPYVQRRFPSMEKASHFPDLHRAAQEMWVKYLRETGHADAVSFMLGLPEDYQCKP